MRKLFLVGALALASLTAAGCSGCSVLTKVADPAHGVAEGQKIDEQAMGAADTLGTSANLLITAAVKTGAMSRAQLLQAQKLRAEIDAAHTAALAAYRAGQAKSFSDKLAAINDLARKAQALFNEVKA